MLGEAVGIGLCLLLWGTRAYLAVKYVVKYRVGREYRRTWKHGTPDWVTRVAPWLEFLGWVALLGSIAWWVLHPASVVGATKVEVCPCPRSFQVSHCLLTARAR
jgi:hypothetical protein